MLFALLASSTLLLLRSPAALEAAGEIRDAASIVQFLSSKAGKSVLVDPRLGKHLLYFQEHDQTPGTCLRAVATALHASLQKEGDDIKIARSDSDLQTLKKDRTLHRMAWIEEHISKVERFRKSVLSTGALSGAFVQELDKEAKQTQEFYEGKRESTGGFFATQLLPQEELLEGLVKRIGIERLSSLSSDQTTIFEDKPTVGNLPLPEHGDLLQALARSIHMRGKLDLSEEKSQEAALYGMSTFLLFPDENSSAAEKLRLECRSLVNEMLYLSKVMTRTVIGICTP